MKRLLDIFAASVALIVLSPIILTVALIIKNKLGMPIFFRQLRPGLNEKPFEMIKFRTMLNLVDSDGNILPESDRLTSFGSFLRSTSLDELPCM